jgi:hypothetical protein
MLAANRLVLTGCCSAIVLTFFAPKCLAQASQTGRSEPTCVDLAKYYNASLTNSLNSPSYVKENNLAALPAGRQTFSGVPFQVGGVLQLTGKKVQEWGRKEFPEAIKGIPVGRKFSRLHILHGAGGVYDEDGTVIAKLVLHYDDGSAKEITIRNGVDVRDWWGDPQQTITGTNSVLAWTGSNPALKQYGGNEPGALRIYRSTFANPQPGLLVTKVDFESTMANSSPFLLALTVE